MNRLKIGVLGDTHEDYKSIDDAMKHFTDVDYIFHTGDHHDDIEYIINRYKVKVLGVRGNCDWTGATEISKKFSSKRILLIHGHQYNVKFSLNNLYYKGQEENADMVIFGHTHLPLYVVENNMILLNPGSTGLPRGGSTKSCALIEINDKISVKLIALV